MIKSSEDILFLLDCRTTRFFGMRSLLLYMVGTYLLSIIGSADLESRQCPQIHDGTYSFCVCEQQLAYDISGSIGVYPNCTCQHKNFNFNIILNESPNCNYSPEVYGFSKTLFECIACPKDSARQYLDCSCDDDSPAYEIIKKNCERCDQGSYGNFPNCTCDLNFRRCVLDSKNGSIQCPFGSEGTYPNCTCQGDGIYNSLTNICNECPYHSTGVYPNCICKFDGTYNRTTNLCISCPFKSDGVYPDCVCQGTAVTYEVDSNSCYSCPANSSGTYPNCDCEHSFVEYFRETNSCERCPENSTGVYPHCKCNNGYYSKTLSSCIECPPDATGFYPACKCNDENTIFSAFINQCYRECPANSSGIQPDCICDKGCGEYYDATDVACKSNIGRTCPSDSNGTGPDCLCVRENHYFDTCTWECFKEGTYGAGFGISHCPGNGKWPQCEASIDFKVLQSSIG